MFLRPVAFSVPPLVVAALTVTVICFTVVAPPLSVTVALIVWLPTVSTLVKAAPAPIAPSRLDVQASFADSDPSCGSLAEPLNDTEVPLAWLVPLPGLAMVTDGAVFDDATTTVTCRSVESPPLSMAVALMVCVPAESPCVKDPPAPIAPSMFDVQDSADVSWPSCVSLADPVNVTEAPLA